LVPTKIVGLNSTLGESQCLHLDSEFTRIANRADLYRTPRPVQPHLSSRYPEMIDIDSIILSGYKILHGSYLVTAIEADKHLSDHLKECPDIIGRETSSMLNEILARDSQLRMMPWIVIHGVAQAPDEQSLLIATASSAHTLYVICREFPGLLQLPAVEPQNTNVKLNHEAESEREPGNSQSELSYVTLLGSIESNASLPSNIT